MAIKRKAIKAKLLDRDVALSGLQKGDEIVFYCLSNAVVKRGKKLLGLHNTSAKSSNLISLGFNEGCSEEKILQIGAFISLCLGREITFVKSQGRNSCKLVVGDSF